MSDIQETKQCPNCKIEILCSNYTIHFVHCQRNFYLCTTCEQPVNFDKRAEHEEKSHVITYCTGCQLALQAYRLDDHLLNDCPNRKIKCQTCDIEVEALEITEHEDYCGSRTEKCEECGEYVMLKYKSLHLESNHTFIKLSDEPGPSPSWQYGKRMLYNFMPDLSSKNYKPTSISKKKSVESSGRSRNRSDTTESEETDDLTSKNINYSFNDIANHNNSKSDIFEDAEDKKSFTKDLEEWPMLGGIRSLQISKGKQDNTSSNPGNEDEDFMYALKMSQDIWKKEASEGDDILKNCFKPLNEDEPSKKKSGEMNMFEKNFRQLNEQATESDLNFFYDKNESVKLPCEFCGNLIVSNDLILHQTKCSLYMTEIFRERKNSPSEAAFFDEGVEKKIACGICNKFFRLSSLENHELICRRTSTKLKKNVEKINLAKNVKTTNTKSEPGIQNNLDSVSPQMTGMSASSEPFSDLSKRHEGGKKSNLKHPDSGVLTKTKVSRKSRRAPSPPRRQKTKD